MCAWTSLEIFTHLTCALHVRYCCGLQHPIRLQHYDSDDTMQLWNLGYHLFTIKLAFSLFTFVYFKILCYSFVNWVSNLWYLICSVFRKRNPWLNLRGLKLYVKKIQNTNWVYTIFSEKSSCSAVCQTVHSFVDGEA